MIRQSQAKIFLADERGIMETGQFRVISTFNFGHYQQQHKQPFGALLALNECTLAAGQTQAITLTALAHVVIIPIVGGVEVTFNASAPLYAEAGSIQVFTLREGEGYRIHNPYDTELVKYLELHIAATQTDEPVYNQFDLDTNTLITILSRGKGGQQYHLKMMKLKGRQEEIVRLTDPANGMFFYVLQGACEVEYRLLHAGDGLALWNIPEAEFEALSEDAIILIAEVAIN